MEFGLIELATVRLKLRELNSDDEEALFDIYSDKEALRYWDSLPFTTLSQASEMISNTKEWWEAGDSICLAIEEPNSNLVIGTMSLFNFHQESKRAEIGYILKRSYWGYGFMTEVLIKTIDYSFFDL
jgi:ribosomal-protein-alanine N-acetyltransferase